MGRNEAEAIVTDLSLPDDRLKVQPYLDHSLSLICRI
jgi:hypothetical protein